MTNKFKKLLKRSKQDVEEVANDISDSTYDILKKSKESLNSMIDMPAIAGAKQIYSIDLEDVVKRFIKYLLLGFVLVLASRFSGAKPLPWKTCVTIAMVGVTCYAIIDTYSPTVGISDSAEVVIRNKD